jgi:hypothetical protein
LQSSANTALGQPCESTGRISRFESSAQVWRTSVSSLLTLIRLWPPGVAGRVTRTIEPARALAAETLSLERTLSDLVNQAYALTPAEIALMWQTARSRMPIPPPV